MHIYVCLYIHTHTHTFIYLSVCLSVYLSIYLYQEPGRLGELEAPTSRTTFLRKIIISYVIVFALVLTNRSKSKFKKKD